MVGLHLLLGGPAPSQVLRGLRDGPASSWVLRGLWSLVGVPAPGWELQGL